MTVNLLQYFKAFGIACIGRACRQHTQGGSLRIYARHDSDDSRPVNARVEELMGHYVNYRKVLGLSRTRSDDIRLYAVSTRYPSGLFSRTPAKEIKTGVWEVKVLSRRHPDNGTEPFASGAAECCNGFFQL